MSLGEAIAPTQTHRRMDALSQAFQLQLLPEGECYSTWKGRTANGSEAVLSLLQFSNLSLLKESCAQVTDET